MKSSLFAIGLILAAHAGAAVWYVDCDVATSGDGTSWATAFKTIEDARYSALEDSGGEVWVAEGTYTGTNGGLHALIDNVVCVSSTVAVYGGFAGTESTRDERDWSTHVTIIDAEDTSGRRAVFMEGGTLDGFTITGGNADDVGSEGGLGGGVYCDGFGTIANCIITGNSGAEGGGGMYMTNSQFWVTACVFSNNYGYNGGGLLVSAAEADLFNCVFLGNTASSGGGICNSGSAPADSYIVNCSFYGNSATNEGDGMLNWDASPVVQNCILWGSNDQWYDQGSAAPTVSYCDIQQASGAYSGTGNINADPLFVSASDLRLQSTSPCINTAIDNTYTPAADIAGTARPKDTTSDMGAYEMDTGSLTVTIEPAGARTAGAQWRVDGGAWQNSGDTVTALTVGSHTVSYSDVGGWTTPSDDSVPVTSGATASTTGTYTGLTGSLTVTIEPAAARTAGAQWRVDGGSWQNSGDTVSGLTAGSHTVSYSTVTNWTTPSDESVSVSGGSAASTTGTYVEHTGSLTVTIEPAAARTAGAQWRVGGGAWQNSGDTVSGLSVGAHTVSYNTVGGWTTPSDESVSITNGATTSTTGTYIEHTGSLTVTIEPAAARTAGAQ
ncbi:MAG: hypothetical protein JXR94_15935, partial [Candidatus Hydrogenedentes bacterium]|nr:hypothetical protein [Candidatus Hydrogenedentota bacterium]